MADRHQLHSTVCTSHGKRLYGSRDTAKQAIRRQHARGMRAYRCEFVDGYWHIGHLPPAVREGRKTAPEVYGEAG